MVKANKLEEKSMSTNIKLEKRKIIVVDDNIALADLMGRIFTILNQDVSVAYDGAKVLELVRTKKPNIIFIDISMSTMNGYELVKILRRDSSLKKTKMMALSGLVEESRQKSKEAGFDGHLTKPISITDLEKILSQL